MNNDINPYAINSSLIKQVKKKEVLNKLLTEGCKSIITEMRTKYHLSNKEIWNLTCEYFKRRKHKY